MSLKEFIKVTKALRDPNRVSIVKMLQHGELCVCEIQAALGMSQSNVSKHLAILTAAGLVERRKEGLWAYYLLCGAPRSPYAASLLGSLRFWLEGDEEVAQVIRRIPDIRRKNLCGFNETQLKQKFIPKDNILTKGGNEKWKCKPRRSSPY